MLWPALLFYLVVVIAQSAFIQHWKYICVYGPVGNRSKDLNLKSCLILLCAERKMLSLRSVTNSVRLLLIAVFLVWSLDQLWWLGYLVPLLHNIIFFLSSSKYSFIIQCFFSLCSLCSVFLHLSHFCGLIWHSVSPCPFNTFLRFPSDYFALMTECWIKCLI